MNKLFFAVLLLYDKPRFKYCYLLYEKAYIELLITKAVSYAYDFFVGKQYREVHFIFNHLFFCFESGK